MTFTRAPGSVARRVTVTLSQEMADAVNRFRSANEFVSQHEAIRVLIAMSLSQTPEDGIVSARGQEAYIQVRSWLMAELREFFKQKLFEFEESIDSVRSA